MKKKIFIILTIIIGFMIVGCSKKMDKLDGISMIIKDGTLTRTSATIIITDTSGKKNEYGEWFRIDKKVNGNWKKLDMKVDDYWIKLVAHKVDSNNKLEMNLSWKSIYGDLENGEYRLVKEVNNEYFSVEFTIDGALQDKKIINKTG